MKCHLGQVEADGGYRCCEECTLGRLLSYLRSPEPHRDHAHQLLDRLWVEREEIHLALDNGPTTPRREQLTHDFEDAHQRYIAAARVVLNFGRFVPARPNPTPPEKCPAGGVGVVFKEEPTC